MLSRILHRSRSSRVAFARFALLTLFGALGWLTPGNAAQYGRDGDGSISRHPDLLNNSIHGPLSPERQLIPKVIYFPPDAPPLGAVIDFSEAKTSISRAPDVLAPFVGESFYAPLSTFISPVITAYQGGDGFDAGDVSRLRTFQNLRNRLLADLHRTIDRSRGAPDAERLRRFESLARDQASDLERLEELAEELRERLARRANWSEFRNWRLRLEELSSQPGAYYSFQIQVIRAAAFYQEGLSPAQRRLLREVAIEMAEKAHLERGTLATSRLYEYFLPETARVRFPSPLPGPLAGKMRRFLFEKDDLKKELGDAVISADDAMSSARNSALRELAKRHAPRFTLLEELAEEIRRELPGTAGLTRWPRPAPIPDELLERIVRSQLRYKELWRDTTEPAPAAVRAMEEELNALHRSLELATGSALDRPNVAEADAFLAKFLHAHQQQRAYYDYDWAALEPGLSPAQRRLLFRAALADLGLPLPGADVQATSLFRR